jgi:hypothetical protein
MQRPLRLIYQGLSYPRVPGARGPLADSSGPLAEGPTKINLFYV